MVVLFVDAVLMGVIMAEGADKARFAPYKVVIFKVVEHNKLILFIAHELIKVIIESGWIIQRFPCKIGR